MKILTLPIARPVLTWPEIIYIKVGLHLQSIMIFPPSYIFMDKIILGVCDSDVPDALEIILE